MRRTPMTSRRGAGAAAMALLIGVALATPDAATADVSGLSTAPTASDSATGPALPRPGRVLRSGPLPERLWIPKATRRAWKLTYVTTDSHGERALSTGPVFIPHGTPPRGGWPVISWAHGLSGLGDACAPSRVGPVEKQRDWSYLRTWMKQGYAIVASDYV